MTESNLPLNAAEIVELNNINHPEWDEPIICRVEVDLPGWLTQLTNGKQWEVFSEDEAETCISFSLRERDLKPHKQPSKLASKLKPRLAPRLAAKLAEVTLYHNGYAVVDVDGKALFGGTLTNGTSDCAHLTYFHADSGEPITLN
ncbi:MAG: hypothetical protein H7Z20_03225 [Bdellovibrio sp.]|nr:hypothetical protein [Methylotenera sp.]